MDRFKGIDFCELTHVVPALNRHRYYRIQVDLGLFGPMVVRTWGRIGHKLKDKSEMFDSMDDALNKANQLFRHKIKRGYQEEKE